MNQTKQETTVACYTTAPADYDWGCVRSSKVVGKDKRGRDIRCVEIEPRMADAQQARYGSGNHMSVDETEWLKLVDYNLVTKAD